jgi:hypothetical protein
MWIVLCGLFGFLFRLYANKIEVRLGLLVFVLRLVFGCAGEIEKGKKDTLLPLVASVRS